MSKNPYSWQKLQKQMHFTLDDYRYPYGAVLRVESTNIRFSLGARKHPTVRDRVASLRELYPSRDIYITLPSKITAEWQPKQ